MTPGRDSAPSSLEPSELSLHPQCLLCHLLPCSRTPSLGLVLVKATRQLHNPDIVPALSWENEEEIPVPAPRACVPREVLGSFGPSGAQQGLCQGHWCLQQPGCDPTASHWELWAQIGLWGVVTALKM